MQTLRTFGWSAHFQSQLALDDLDAFDPLRVAAVHRTGADLIAPDGPRRIETGPDLPSDQLAVGDWVLADRATGRLVRLLARKSLLQRRAAGTGRAVQLIAANVDTLFITSSCNAEFNPARIERYLVLARQAGVFPVVLLTKADTCADPQEFAARAARLAPGLAAEALNALDPAGIARLAPWCGPGQTVALAGSSGVGKSTLVNALTGAAQTTRGIREDDARGRHTTTARSLHAMPTGAWLIDTPGMRALPLHDAAEGVAAVFEDLVDLAGACRFADCAHATEPGCALQAAISDGRLEPSRLRRWQKLQREEAHNTASLEAQRSAARALGRRYRSVQTAARDRRGR